VNVIQTRFVVTLRADFRMGDSKNRHEVAAIIIEPKRTIELIITHSDKSVSP
jgi:hypothetical protein